MQEWEISTMYKFSCIKLISKAFTQFSGKIGNVVNHAFLVLIFWVKNLVGANSYAFRNNVWEVGAV